MQSTCRLLCRSGQRGGQGRHRRPTRTPASRSSSAVPTRTVTWFHLAQGDGAQAPAFVLTECPSPAPQELSTLLRLQPHYKFVTLDYLTASVASAHRLTVGYKPTVIAQGGRYYAVGNTAQRLPRQVRLLLFGNSHWEIDISGAHYELMRRLCKAVEVHLDLPPITQARLSLREAIGNQVAEGDIDQLVKKRGRWSSSIVPRRKRRPNISGSA